MKRRTGEVTMGTDHGGATTMDPEARGEAVAADRALLSIEGLRTHFTTPDGVVKAVDGVDFAVRPGTTMCVVGESGCGKSMTARSVLQLIEPPGEVVDGKVLWSPDGGEPVDLAALDTDGEEIRQVRGGQIGMVFQEPMSSLSPMYTVGAQLIETIRLHREISKEAAREVGVELLRRVGIPHPERRMDVFPFQLSGGMCQRVMIAIALSCDPRLLIADEPTTALDVTTQARILDLLKDLQAENGMGMLFITHDLGVVAEIADEVTVMYLGKVAERGTVEQIFSEPKHPYTQALLRSIPDVRDGGERQRLRTVRGMVPHPQNRPSGCPFRSRCDFAMPGICDQEMPPATDFDQDHRTFCYLYSHPDAPGSVPEAPGAEESEPAGASEPVESGPPAQGDRPTVGPVAVVEPRRPEEEPATSVEPLLQVKGLTKHYPIGGGMFRRPTGNVRAVDGVDLSIAPGQTMGLVGESGCGKTTMGRAIARLIDATSGQILYREAGGDQVDLATLSGRALGKYRTQVRVIFQDPFSSLNPRMTVEQIVGEPLLVNKMASGSERQDRVAEMLRRVGIRPEYMPRYPHAFSGGERQRLNIARALITNPRLVIADEPVSALDVSIRAQILNLLVDVQEEFGLTYLFISHDLSVVEHVSDRVAVMYLGKIAEEAETGELYRRPRHPYTETLLHSVPIPDPSRREARLKRAGTDDLPDPANQPDGCLFHTRCPHVQTELCPTDRPALRTLGDGRVACHYAEKLALSGVATPTTREADQV
ncbi:dipeptide ABC transporter ATP-binding protein [Pseudactinotalea sp. Z1739]|uniref:ABC transporter ATP-binding protein n=1 Tax=Pseudactinotalea sp. Z1739 TaxID=3413028 RepID=UPI003C7EB9EC